MSLNIKQTTNMDEAAHFIAGKLKEKLQRGEKVLLFVTGGSSIDIAALVPELLSGISLDNLTITLTDERYGEPGHKDSNWFQLGKKGFAPTGARLIPILSGHDIEGTTEEFSNVLREELEKAEYKIGMFGVGSDGHTAGILPKSPATESKDLAAHYDTEAFSRITMTFNAIEKLDEAVVWMQGENKWPVLKNLEKDTDIKELPAQVLKKVPLLTIFTDYTA